jgi:dihydrofolate reductase
MNKPSYIAIAAVTLDGKIAKGPNHMSDWTSKEDKLFMRSLLDKCDVILVGNNTYKTASKPLSKRNCIVLSYQINSCVRQSARLLYINPQKHDLSKIVFDLKYQRVAILGGAQTYTYCLNNNLLDELYLTIEPIIFGRGINLFSLAQSENWGRSGDPTFKLISVKKINRRGSLLLHYKK